MQSHPTSITMVHHPDTPANRSWAMAVVMRQLDGAMLANGAADAGLAGAIECGERLLAAANDDHCQETANEQETGLSPERAEPR
jgi:hypothetical protein